MTTEPTRPSSARGVCVFDFECYYARGGAWDLVGVFASWDEAEIAFDEQKRRSERLTESVVQMVDLSTGRAKVAWFYFLGDDLRVFEGEGATMQIAWAQADRRQKRAFDAHLVAMGKAPYFGVSQDEAKAPSSDSADSPHNSRDGRERGALPRSHGRWFRSRPPRPAGDAKVVTQRPPPSQQEHALVRDLIEGIGLRFVRWEDYGPSPIALVEPPVGDVLAKVSQAVISLPGRHSDMSVRLFIRQPTPDVAGRDDGPERPRRGRDPRFDCPACGSDQTDNLGDGEQCICLVCNYTWIPTLDENLVEDTTVTKAGQPDTSAQVSCERCHDEPSPAVVQILSAHRSSVPGPDPSHACGPCVRDYLASGGPREATLPIVEGAQGSCAFAHDDRGNVVPKDSAKATSFCQDRAALAVSTWEPGSQRPICIICMTRLVERDPAVADALLPLRPSQARVKGAAATWRRRMRTIERDRRDLVPGGRLHRLTREDARLEWLAREKPEAFRTMALRTLKAIWSSLDDPSSVPEHLDPEDVLEKHILRGNLRAEFPMPPSDPPDPSDGDAGADVP